MTSRDCSSCGRASAGILFVILLVATHSIALAVLSAVLFMLLTYGGALFLWCRCTTT